MLSSWCLKSIKPNGPRGKLYISRFIAYVGIFGNIIYVSAVEGIPGMHKCIVSIMDQEIMLMIFDVWS